MTDNEQIDEMMYAAEIEQRRHETKPEEKNRMTKETIAQIQANRLSTIASKELAEFARKAAALAEYSGALGEFIDSDDAQMVIDRVLGEFDFLATYAKQLNQTRERLNVANAVIEALSNDQD